MTEKQTRQFKPIDLIKQFRNGDNKSGFQSLTCLEKSENCIHRIISYSDGIYGNNIEETKKKLDRLGGKNKNGIIFVDTQRPVGEEVRRDSGYHGLEPRKSIGLQIQHQGMIFQEEVVLLNGKETIERF